MNSSESRIAHAARWRLATDHFVAAGVAAAIAFAVAGRTTLPERFTLPREGTDECPHMIEAQGADGFSLEIAHTEFRFFPNADPVVVAARVCFARTAAALAKHRGMSIAPLTAADLHATSNRNVADLTYLVTVTGRVRYLQR